MAKHFGKVILGAACAGAAVGAVLFYMKDRGFKKGFQDDFNDFTDEFEENGQRRYTTIPYSAPDGEAEVSQ